MQSSSKQLLSKAHNRFLVASLAGIALYLALPSGGPVQAMWYVVFTMSAAVAVVVGVRRARPAHPVVWYLFASALIFDGIGSTIWAYYEQILHIYPFPSVATVFYLGYFPLLAVALWLLSKARTGRKDVGALLDACLITTGSGLVLWALVVTPYIADWSAPVVTQAVSLAYPLGSILLIAMLTRVALSPARGYRVVLTALILAPLLRVSTDTVFVFAQGWYASGNPLDAGWMLSFMLFGYAALHPHMATVTAAAHEPERASLSAGRVVFMLLAVLAVPTTLVVQELNGHSVDTVLLAGGSGLMFVLVLARMSGLVRRVQEMVRQLQSRETDLSLALSLLEEAQTERGQLLEQTVWSIENERKLLAAELHDGPIQRLAAAAFKLELTRLQLQDGRTDEATGLVVGVQGEVTTEIIRLRDIMCNLRPPVLDERGVQEAICDLARTIESTHNFRCTVTVELSERLKPSVEIVLYRVVQEALANIGKHADARHVLVALASTPEQAELTIIDDGTGFNLQQSPEFLRDGHAGLAVMRERVQLAGGTWGLRSSAGQGTHISVTLPTPLDHPDIPGGHSSATLIVAGAA